MLYSSKKSQSAMEFMMTYGWAFLIVLIVIFSLIYFGVLDPDVFLPEKVDLQEGVSIVDASADENSISFILRNTLGRDIHDFQLNATECNDGNGTLSTAVDIPEGKTRKITIYCEHDYAVGSKIDSGLEALWKTRTSTKGSRYDFDQKTRGNMKVTVNEGKELYDREEISVCGTLDQEKTIYTLYNNLTVSGPCFTIGANYITLDLNGFTIDGPTESLGVNISNYNFTTIKNGYIYDFIRGISSVGGYNGTFYNLTIKFYGGSHQGMDVRGITIDGGGGNNISDNNISNCTIFPPFGYLSLIYLTNSLDNYIINNTIDLNRAAIGPAYGLAISGSNNTVIRGNLISSNSAGIYFWNTNLNNNITECNISNSSYYDVDLGTTGTLNTRFLNTNYSSEHVVSGSELIRGWYYKAYVNDTSGNPVVGATLQALNSSGDLVRTLTTGSDGWTEKGEIIDYVNYGGTRSYYSNYSIDAYNATYSGLSKDNNISAVNNSLDNVITLYRDFIAQVSYVKNVSTDVFKFTYGKGIAIDGDGNIYSTGNSNGAFVNFGNGVSFDNPDTSYQVYVVKQDSNGLAQWVANVTGSNTDTPTDIVVDYGGNIYVTGYTLSPTLDFGNGKIFTRTGINNGLFVVKYNNDGIAQWAAGANGNDNDFSIALSVDDDGNVYVTGHSKSATPDFGDGKTFVNSGDYDFFVVKYDADGNTQWVKNAVGTVGGTDNAVDITVDSDGSVYATGYAKSTTVDFGNGQVFSNTAVPHSEVFVVKYDTNGVAQWVANASGSWTDLGHRVAVDNNGNVYAIGRTISSSLYFGNNVNFSKVGLYDLFLVKYNSSGVAQWVSNASATQNVYGYGLAVDSRNNIYIGGHIDSSSANFGNGITFDNSGSGNEIFLVKYDRTGVAQSLINASGSSSDSVVNIIADENGFVYLIGTTSSSILDFGNGINFSKTGSLDTFIVKYR